MTLRLCKPKPNRKRARVYTERDVGRIVAYARNDGASDALLIAYILQSFGLRKIQCVIFKILDVLNTGSFLAAILLVIKGLVGLLKVIKIMATGKVSKLTLNVLELILPKALTKTFAVFTLWVSAAELAMGTIIIFINAMANNVALFLLMKGVCEAEVAELNVPVSTLDTSTLFDDFDDAFRVLVEIGNKQLEGK